MNKFIKLFLIITSLSIIFVSCTGEANSPTENSPTENPTTGFPKRELKSSILSKINIDNANALFISENQINKSPVSNRQAISGETSSTNSLLSKNKLFKITDDGVIEEIIYTYTNTYTETYEDENGEIKEKEVVEEEIQTETKVPNYIYSLSEQYFIIKFEEDCCLVDKTSGSIYEFTKILSPEKNLLRPKDIYFDSFGNIYFLNSGRIVKIDTSNINNLSYTFITPESDTVYGFEVNSYGDCICYGNYGGSSNRIIKRNGGLYNLPATIQGYWLGLKDIFYYLDADFETYQSSLGPKLKSVKVNADFTVTAEEKYINDAVRWSTGSYSHWNDYKIMTDNRVLLIDKDEGVINEFDNENTEPRVINLDGKKFDKVLDIQQSSNYYYILGKLKGSSQTILFKISLQNDSYTTLFSDDSYDVYMFSVSSEDEISFNALRMEDGKKVIGNVDNNGQVSIVEANTNIETVCLKKLN